MQGACGAGPRQGRGGLLRTQEIEKLRSFAMSTGGLFLRSPTTCSTSYCLFQMRPLRGEICANFAELRASTIFLNYCRLSLFQLAHYELFIMEFLHGKQFPAKYEILSSLNLSIANIACTVDYFLLNLSVV